MAIIDKAKDQKLVNLCDWSSHQCLRNEYLLDQVLKFFSGEFPLWLSGNESN